MNPSKKIEPGSSLIEPGDEPAQAAKLTDLSAIFRPGRNWLNEFASHRDEILRLMPCSGAAIAMHGDICCSSDDYVPVARAVHDELPQQSGHHLYYSNQWRPADSIPTQAKCQSVLAIRFNPAQAGWLMWFQIDDPQGDSGQRWSPDNISLAERIRTQLMELCLESASQSLSEQHQLISALGHNLLNPLQAISMSSLLLRQTGERNLDLRKHISTSSNRMEGLIKHALDINRIQAGEKVSLSPTRADISGLVVAAINEAGTDTSVQTHFDEKVEASIDPDRYRQVITTLLHFAASVQRPGSVLHAELKQQTDVVRFSLIVSVDDAVLAAARANALIAQPDLSSLASPLPTAEGTGLYIANAVAAAHGGALTFAGHGKRLAIEFTVTTTL